ncbi:MAG: hypothetical protein HGA31_05295 [Candidatus Moranbacteria bacterium]|nr:hypothetical protein [Candidatus Moranbacteria bacterium]
MKMETMDTLERIVKRWSSYEVFEDQISISTPFFFVVDAVWGKKDPRRLAKQMKESLAMSMMERMLGPIGIDAATADPELTNLLLGIIDRNMRYHITVETFYTTVAAYMDFLVTITAERIADGDTLLERLKPSLIKAMATSMISVREKPISDRISGWKNPTPPDIHPRLRTKAGILKQAIGLRSTMLALEARG